jgi:hypothetical protein
MEIYSENPGINTNCTDNLGTDFKAFMGWQNRFLNQEQ